AVVAELRRLVADRERCDELVSAGDELARGSDCWVLPNVWLGSSVESQRWVRIRIPRLIEAPATIRFLSCEPFLEPVDLKHWLLVAGQSSPIRRAIAGGESGPGTRPMDLMWARLAVRLQETPFWPCSAPSRSG